MGYPAAEQVVLVWDNLNTHSIASLYRGLASEEARRLAQRQEAHDTPHYGSWLNMAKIELAMLARQCLAERMDGKPRLQEQVA